MSERREEAGVLRHFSVVIKKFLSLVKLVLNPLSVEILYCDEV